MLRRLRFHRYLMPQVIQLRLLLTAFTAALVIPVAARAQSAPTTQAVTANAATQRASFTWSRQVSTRREAEALAFAMRRELGSALASDDPRLTQSALIAAKTMLNTQGITVDTAQIVLVVDRAVSVQRLWVISAYPDAQPWDVIGQVRVSTGKPGRKEHFRTPIGVFLNSTAVLGYRAQGTFNENHILGNGTRGMRVWDFGWQTTDDWRTRGALMAVRLEMHATDPTVLESRLGRPDSEGCIRIPSKFDSFLDLHGLIDAQLQEAAKTERRFAALLPKDATPTPLAGQIVVVVDTSDPSALPSDPALANTMEQPPTPPVSALTPTPEMPTPRPAVGQKGSG